MVASVGGWKVVALAEIYVFQSQKSGDLVSVLRACFIATLSRKYKLQLQKKEAQNHSRYTDAGVMTSTVLRSNELLIKSSTIYASKDICTSSSSQYRTHISPFFVILMLALIS